MKKFLISCLCLVLLLTGCGSSGGGSSSGSASLPDESVASGSSVSASSAADGSASQSTQDQTEATGPQRVEGISVTVDGMDGTYTGTVNEAGKPDGSGTFDVTWGDLKGSTYVGDFVDGSMEGTGSFEFMDGSSYTGGTHASNFLGKGYLTFSDGEKFYGDFIDNRNATGTYTDLDGIQWEAELKDGQVVQGKQLSAEAPDNSSQSASSEGASSSSESSSPKYTLDQIMKGIENQLGQTYDNVTSSYSEEDNSVTFFIVEPGMKDTESVMFSDAWDATAKATWKQLLEDITNTGAAIDLLVKDQYQDVDTTLYVCSALTDKRPLVAVTNGDLVYDASMLLMEG